MNRHAFRFASLLFAATAFAACASEDEEDVEYEYIDDEAAKADGFDPSRYAGDPREYDPGPPAGSGWAELFAEVPNYRAVARAHAATWLTPGADGRTKLDITNEELVAAGKDPIPAYTLTVDKFRFEMGPIFYRGRLDGTARVMIVGQDAATDEAVVHRAFVGGTGQKVQNWLNEIGITRSYICLNTFIYSIYEQFDPFTAELATLTPIRDHRSRVFEKAFTSSPIKLIASFGSAAHTSVQNWLDDFHGGTLPSGVLWVKMLHPGMAATAYDPTMPDTAPNQEILTAVMDSFARGWSKVWTKKNSQKSWLPADPGARTYKASKFYYMSAAIPWRDLPYGFPRGLGRGGTKTERGGGTRVQIRSDAGTRYMAPSLPPIVGVTKAKSGFAKTIPAELAWEPPKFDAESAHDPGPDATWVDAFAATPPYATVIAESTLAVENDFDTPVWYRGRINGGARVLVIAQNASFDAFVGGRTLIGDEGQHINHMFDKIGITPDQYVMITPYPFAVPRTLPAADLLTLTNTPALTAARTAILEKILAEHPIEVVFLFGAGADAAFTPVANLFSGTVIRLSHPSDSSGVSTSWNSAMRAYDALDGVTDPSLTNYTSSAFGTSRAQIPREDLPYGKPLWFGTSGSPSQQPDAHWIFWNAPRWVSNEPAN